MERLISLCGLVVMIGIGWAMSSHRSRINWRTVGGGVALQFAFAVLILRTDVGRRTFEVLGQFFETAQQFTDSGAKLVFGANFMDHYFAFRVLPTIIFYSTLMSVLYYLGVMQWVVRMMAMVMQRSLGTSGAESLSAAANIFVGQTEAPLLIKPYIGRMTNSEITAVMVGGFATIAGGVMAAYINMGINAGHMLTASVISAPAALVMAKLIMPETEQSETAGVVIRDVPKAGANVFEAASLGAADGLQLALNVAAMLIAFTALMAMINGGLVWVSTTAFNTPITLGQIMGYVFAPLAWLMGVPQQDCMKVGELLGIRTVTNEFIAYEQLAKWLDPKSGVDLTQRSKAILTYALCGFANFASIGIQIGGIGGLIPERRSDIARLGLRAMIGGMLACFMTACIAGILLDI